MSHNTPLSGIHLKFIACAAMCTDHACKVLAGGTAYGHVLSDTVGRIAFPIFAYLLLEGFLHTRDRRKYALNLLVIAVISEPLFDLALHGSWFCPGRQNTCFTLLLGLLLLICLEKCEMSGKLMMILPVAAVFAAAFWFLKVDYDLAAFGIFLILYFCKYQAPWFAGLLISTVLVIGFQTPGAYLCILPLYFYNRQRGRITALSKYLFYAFYPGHLAVLAFLCYA